MLKSGGHDRDARLIASLREERRALPADLRRRLLAIADGAGGCDSGGVYEAAWQEAWRGRIDREVVGHLDDCPRCAALYRHLRASFGRRRRLPSATRDRLLALVRPAALPLWLREARLAVAACWILSLVLTGLAGDAEAVFRETGAAMTTTASSWAGESEQMWRDLLAGAEDGWNRGRGAVVLYGESWQHLFEKTLDACEGVYERSALGQWLASDGDPNDQGDSDDDRSRNDEP